MPSSPQPPALLEGAGDLPVQFHHCVHGSYQKVHFPSSERRPIVGLPTARPCTDDIIGGSLVDCGRTRTRYRARGRAPSATSPAICSDVAGLERMRTRILLMVDERMAARRP